MIISRIFIFLFTLIGMSQASFADNYYYGDNKYLGTDGFCYFDWYKSPNLAKQRTTLETGGQIKLQSRFLWNGSGFVPYVGNKTGEHAIVAFTQGTIEQGILCDQKGITEYLLNSTRQPIRQWIHRYGAGAIISPKGLGLELWNGDGTAILWLQTGNRCAVNIPSGQTNNMCLDSTPNGTNSYITSNPQFQIQKGVYYWLRITLTGNPNGQLGWVRLNAELLQQTIQGQTILLQEGQIEFSQNQFFPNPYTIDALIARTGPEYPESNYIPENILFWAFDYGF